MGISQLQIIQELSSFPSVIADGKLHGLKYSVHARLFISPTRRDDLKIYRQWPSGILLELAEDDLELSLQVVDVKHQDGGVFVYFDKQMRYKGYFVYSAGRYSSDDPARFGKEVSDFSRLGFEAEYWRARLSMDLILAGGDALNRLPRLPLSNNRASNPAPVMP